MQVMIECRPRSLEETKEEIAVFGRYGTEKTYWNIPNRFKQEVFEFLESLIKQEESIDKNERGTHLEALIKKSTVSNTLKEVANLVNPAILEKLYDAGYENGKQSR